MNLIETERALEAKGIDIALDIGVHSRCKIDSNCPIAINMRKIITDSGITLAQLLEGFEEVTAHRENHICPIPIPATLNIRFANKNIPIDVSDVLTDAARVEVETLRISLEGSKRRVQNFGEALWSTYSMAINSARHNSTLPQLKFEQMELLKSGCLNTSTDKEYIFFFPFTYYPEYIVHDGYRTKLCEEHLKLVKKEVYIKMVVNRDRKFLPFLVIGSDGRKLHHYHGSGGSDCWGSVRMPERWDGTLTHLVRVAKLLMGSLKTINMDSLMNHHPDGMPDANAILDKGDNLGKEGELKVTPEVRPVPRRRNPNNPDATVWHVDRGDEEDEEGDRDAEEAERDRRTEEGILATREATMPNRQAHVTNTPRPLRIERRPDQAWGAGRRT